MTPFEFAQERYAGFGVDLDKAIATATQTPISVHCWQGDDVDGFEPIEGSLAGSGLQATGSYPGKATTIEELQADLKFALGLLPGSHRLNLHACYGDFRPGKVERDAITIEQFQGWVDWAKAQKVGIDFNPTYFRHPLATQGTLSSPDASARKFWIQHGIQCRKIAAAMAEQLQSPVVNNTWIPDGAKDFPADRLAPRQRLRESLDAIFAEPVDETKCLDALESKLFGIGSESYVVGSHEFYLSYAVERQKILCLDAGHFHPTESLADKLSGVVQFVPGVLLHVSRGVRWDSDHVVITDDPTRAIFEELVRSNMLSKTYIGLDFFDSSINRIGAWVIGTRAARKCLLMALLQPLPLLRELEDRGDYTARLELLEECKSLPHGIVWEELCKRVNIPGTFAWVDEVRHYEKKVLSARR